MTVSPLPILAMKFGVPATLPGSPVSQLPTVAKSDEVPPVQLEVMSACVTEVAIPRMMMVIAITVFRLLDIETRFVKLTLVRISNATDDVN